MRFGDFEIPGFRDSWIFGFKDFGTLGFLDLDVFGFQDSGISNFHDFVFPGSVLESREILTLNVHKNWITSYGTPK